MTDLPPALAPWRQSLADLPPEVAASVGPWLTPLARRVGPLRVSRADADGPPDGFAGLARRGPYERLIMSEWLLAEVLPDEFIRRAAAREQLFLQLARRTPTGGLRSAVLFDAGPSQLGAPRLVHLAMLIVLAQRAADAGADLRFGVLQSAPEPLDHLSPRTAQQVMHARSARRPTDDDWKNWVAAVSDDEDEQVRDLWVIGGPDAESWATRVNASCVRPDDVLEPGRRAVQANLRIGAASSRLELDLPPDRACVRLLREPYERRKFSAGSTGSHRTLSMRFSDDGRHLFMRTENGVAVLRVALHRGETPGNVRYLHLPDLHVTSVGNHGNRLYVLAGNDEHLVLQSYTKRGQLDSVVRFPVDSMITYPGADQAMAPMISLAPGSRLPRQFVTHDALGLMFRVDTDQGATVPLGEPQYQSLGMARRQGGIEAVVLGDTDDRGNTQLVVIDAEGEITAKRRFWSDETADAFFGPATDPRGVLAVQEDDGWRVIDRGDSMILPSAGQVVGCWVRVEDDLGRAPQLVCLSPDRTFVLLQAAEFTVRSHRLPFVAVESVMPPRHPLLAIRSEDGEVVVINLHRFETAGQGRP